MLAARVYSRPRCRAGRDGILIDERVVKQEFVRLGLPRPGNNRTFFPVGPSPLGPGARRRELRHVIFSAQGGSCKPFRRAWNAWVGHPASWPRRSRRECDRATSGMGLRDTSGASKKHAMPDGLPLASAKLRRTRRCDGHELQRHHAQTAPHPLFIGNLDRGAQNLLPFDSRCETFLWTDTGSVHPNLIDTRASCNIESLLI